MTCIAAKVLLALLLRNIVWLSKKYILTYATLMALRAKKITDPCPRSRVTLASRWGDPPRRACCLFTQALQKL